MVWRVTIMEWETGLRFVDGKVRDELQPGRHYLWPLRSRVEHVDRRPRWLVVPGQDVLTSDGLSVRVSALARWKVVDAARYLTAVASAEADLHTAVQLAVRDAITAVSLDELGAPAPERSAGWPRMSGPRRPASASRSTRS